MPVPFVREQGVAIGFTGGLLNLQVLHLISKANKVIARIYGAGSADLQGNSDLKKLVLDKGGKMFTGSQPDRTTRCGNEGDRKIIAYIQNKSKGKNVELYGYSLGGAAVIRIVNQLCNSSFAEIVLFDPHSLNPGLFPNTITNTKSKTIITFWQKKMISWDNPFTDTIVFKCNKAILPIVGSQTSHKKIKCLK